MSIKFCNQMAGVEFEAEGVLKDNLVWGDENEAGPTPLGIRGAIHV
ncbi:unnamed protein product [Prunus brigantina]